MGTDRQATVEDVEDNELTEEQFNVVRENCDRIVKEIESLMLEVQHFGTDREATLEEPEDNMLLEE
jgi:hypothetical protein